MSGRDVVYHIGHLAVDRAIRDDESGETPTPLTAEATALHDHATRLMALAEDGKAILYQRRCPYGFEYHAYFPKGA
jgi:hypothetical protein